jgi:hypothetical protein
MPSPSPTARPSVIVWSVKVTVTLSLMAKTRLAWLLLTASLASSRAVDGQGSVTLKSQPVRAIVPRCPPANSLTSAPRRGVGVEGRLEQRAGFAIDQVRDREGAWQRPAFQQL